MKTKSKPTVGEKLPVWWACPDNEARILEILPYTGRLGFDCVLRLAAPKTYRGYMDLAYDSSNWAYDQARLK